MQSESPTKAKIGRSAAVIGIAVLCSRLLGLVREQVFAGLFGAGFAYDSFVVAFRIPNLLRDLFGEGALSAAFVTVFSDYNTRKSLDQTWQLASNILSFFAVALSLIVLLGIFCAAPLVDLLAPGFALTAGKSELTVTLTRIMLPFLVCISLAAVVMGILNTKGRFFVPAIASSFFNLGSIIGGTSLAYILPEYGYPAIAGMACGTLIGGLLQLAVQIPSLYRLGFRYKPQLRITDPGLLRVLKLMVPATIGLSATQLNIFINTSFAASCGQGAVSWLNYAFRLVQLPIGLFGVALSIAMLPLLAQQASLKKIDEMKETMTSSLTMVFALTLPATFGLIFLSRPIIMLIFEHGAFTAADTMATAQTLGLYAVGLFAYSANKILVPAFYAINKTKYPVIASFIAVACNLIIINLTIDQFQHLAIALSTSVTMILNFIFLLTVLNREMKGLPLAQLIKNLAKILCACLFLSLILFLADSYLPSLLSSHISLQITSLFATIILATGTYGICLHFLGLEEMQLITKKVLGRFKRS
ncbi:murein biosynthesis integral membrane protein MurJ [Desulfotalea psychrophila]|uniref:Probable lipid II flippase MurJ n=1 Tax=Desulfotalea psychrophila (strain LSv54 / DSM 12343) TaxID=177439 RepID=Q6AKJ7_DESPS|nr:murein biosynthesis integral membrane protein MurJ [Desulfotalea psychrophila]CAG37128.1 related to virulence factor (MviN) [Desulfotalea psychrophila LSv54]